jgi:hypothetical protein
VRSLGVLLALALVLAPAAAAQTATDVVDEAGQALRSDPVYVHPDAETQVDADRIRERIRRGDAGDVFVAVLPESAGRAQQVAPQVARASGQRGVYAVIAGRSFAGGGTDVRVSDLATDAVNAKGSEGGTAIVLDFIDRVADRRASAGGGEPSGGGSSGGGGSGGDGGGASGGLLLGLLGILGLGFLGATWVGRKRRRQREQAELAEVKTVARDDLVALGDDIRALDLDVEMPDADPQAKQFYGQAVDAYTRAEERFDLARRPEDMEPVSRTLEEGRYAMTAAKARLEGRPVPERTPPCFFDPRHGPSAEQVEWAPPGGQPRPVPVCAADAARIRDGEQPMTREIDIDGERMPYYNAPAYYGGWSGGFFGGFGGFLPGMLLGSMFMGGWGGDTYIENNYGGDGGDWGGGDFGGGDFGGGDFGGGDFGGGDF